MPGIPCFEGPSNLFCFEINPITKADIEKEEEKTSLLSVTERLSDVLDEASLVARFEQIDFNNIQALPKKLGQPILLQNVTDEEYKVFLTWLAAPELLFCTELDEGDIIVIEFSPTQRHEAPQSIVARAVKYYNAPNINSPDRNE